MKNTVDEWTPHPYYISFAVQHDVDPHGMQDAVSREVDLPVPAAWLRARLLVVEDVGAWRQRGLLLQRWS